jgi:tight adherence protein C
MTLDALIASPASLVLTLLAVSGALGLAVLAAGLLGRGAEIAGRLGGVVDPGPRGAEAAAAAAAVGLAKARGRGLGALAAPFRRLGEMMRDTAMVSEKDVAEFQRQMASAGLNPRAAVPTFLGVKAVLLLALPLLGFGYATLQDYDAAKLAISVFGGIAAAVMGPNIVLGMLRRPYEQKLRKGLPDAMDLLVVTAEAGLGLESALDRVVREIRHSNPAVAVEFSVLVNELRLMPDRREALDRFAERSSIEGFKRLAATLSQTLRYGTPLSQALRTLSAEMRTERMLKIEERAIRLPALLIIPLILFIMPCVFIALVGPSVLELGRTMGSMGQQ